MQSGSSRNDLITEEPQEGGGATRVVEKLIPATHAYGNEVKPRKRLEDIYYFIRRRLEDIYYFSRSVACNIILMT